MNQLVRLCAFFLVLMGGIACAQEDNGAPSLNDGAGSAVAIPADAGPSVSRAVIMCGLTGDDEHRKLYSEMIENLYTGLTTHHGFKPVNVTVLWTDALPESPGPALQARWNRKAPASAPSPEGIEAETASGREAIAAIAGELENATTLADRLWVFVFGHSHYDGRYSWLNLPGPDLHHIEFGKQFANVRCREQAFFITASASGFYLKSLAAPQRIVISATEPDLEVNETLFPQHLTKVLAEPPPFRELDVDEDGQLTLLDAYLYTCQQTAQAYSTDMLLATEHALLDDTADGRGTEIQADYLTEELGGRLRPGRDKPIRRSGDGAFARKFPLAYPPSPPGPDVE